MKTKLQSLPWLASGAVLMLFSNGRWILPAATWLYPICFLHFLRMNSPGRGFFLLILVSTVVNSIAWWKMIPVPATIYFLITGVSFNIISLAFLGDRLVATKIKGFLSTLVFPFLWCSLEYLSSLSSKGTWYSMAYTQSSNLPLLQLASVTGIWGISFLITWFASVVNWIWDQEFAWEKIRKGSLTFICIGASVLIFGFVRINFFSTGSKSVRTASIVNARDINSGLATCKWTDAKAISSYSKELEENLLVKTQQAARAGARMVVWQEGAGFIPRQEEKLFIHQAGLMAAREKIYLLIAFWSVPEDYPKRPVENKLIILDTGGRILLTYFKNHAAPPEPIKRGDGHMPVVETSYGKIASAICFDAEFPGSIRQAGEQKAGILFLPSNDWKAIDPIHTQMAVLRAIENGFSLVRPAGQGLSIVTDNRGNPISSMDFYKTNEQTMYADVPVQHSNTIYVLLGDWFAWICILGFTVMLIAVIFRKYSMDIHGLQINEHMNAGWQSGISKG